MQTTNIDNISWRDIVNRKEQEIQKIPDRINVCYMSLHEQTLSFRFGQKDISASVNIIRILLDPL